MGQPPNSKNNDKGPRKVKRVAIKTYVVMQRSALTTRALGNSHDSHSTGKIICVKLTASAAQEVVDATAGAFVSKHVATK